MHRNAAQDVDDNWKVLQSTEVGSSRRSVLALGPAESVQYLNREQILELQNALGHGTVFGKWTTPSYWLPPGTVRGRPAIDLYGRVKHYLHHLRPEASMHVEGLVEMGVLVLTRYLILLRLNPSALGDGGKRRTLDPHTVLQIAYGVGPALVAVGISKYLDDFPDPALYSIRFAAPEDRLLSRITQDDLNKLPKTAREASRIECDRMLNYAQRGTWCDVPKFQGKSIAQKLLGTAESNVEPVRRNSYMPLPDDYVGEMGARCHWLIRHLAPGLITLAEKISEIYLQTAAHSYRIGSLRSIRSAQVRKLLQDHEWRDGEGEVFTSPAISIRLPKELRTPNSNLRSISSPPDAETLTGANPPELRWPPKNNRDICALLGFVQMAHYFVIGLSMGARSSEALGLTRDCVAYAEDGRAYANGRTFKLVRRHDGELRDWQLPDFAVTALEQQVRLVAVAEQIGIYGDAKDADFNAGRVNRRHLWCRISAGPQSDSREPLYGINKALESFATGVCMSSRPGGRSLHSHRFRKTLARLVALALTHAPMLLMSVLGHKQIEMTLHYILADKELRAEIDTVSRELRVMRAKTAIEAMVNENLASNDRSDVSYGGYGGLAAISLRSAIHFQQNRVHGRGEDWGANTVSELAEYLTLKGEAWDLVRRGVICTKLPGEAGMCNKSRGRPEPSRCRADCTHRLEEAFMRDDVDGAIADSVAQYEKAAQANEQLAMSQWAAQVRAHVRRFPELEAKWMRVPLVASFFTPLLT